MYELNYYELDSKAVLNLEGQLTVQNISEIRKALLSAINKVMKLVILYDKVDEFDVSYLQLLIAIQKSNSVSGKQLIIKNDKNGKFQKFLEDVGCKTFDGIIEDATEINGGNGNE